ncbi:tetratricopeptide repeat protein [Streptomyces sp. NPDC050658]|uniref:tetratricopeptide repeat protein n=1 Tax=unclassified Streptomyces TaxID=2593676 RepID=UPI003436BF1D
MKFFRPRARRTQAPPVSLARDLYQSGRYAEAEAEASAVARSLPRDDIHVPLALTIVALSIGAQGRHAEALAAYDEALPVFRRVYGADHWQTLKLRSDRAQQLTSLGRHAECEAETAAVVRTATRATSTGTGTGTGTEMRLVAAAASNGLVFALNAQGRHVEAETLAREALDTLREPDRLALVLRLGLARGLNGQARHEEALAEAGRAGELHRGLPPEQRLQESGAVEIVTATALLGLGRAAEARAQAAAAHADCLATLGPVHRRTVEARTLLDRVGGA